MGKIYKTESGDYWDSIAYKVLGSEQYTSDLLAANPEYHSLLILPAGLRLRVPEIATPKPKSLPPWRR